MTDSILPEPLPGFVDWLTEHAGGHAADELTLLLGELVTLVVDIDRPGEMTVKVKLEPAGGAQPGRSVVTRVVSEITKRPKHDPEPSIFYAGPKGTLHRDDPYQQRIDARVVEPEPVVPKNVNPDTGEIRRVTD